MSFFPDESGSKDHLVGASHLASFDNVGASMLTLFEVVTLEGWSENILYALERQEFVGVAYFLGLTILVGGFWLLNLAITVLTNEYEKARECAELKAAAALVDGETGVANDSNENGGNNNNNNNNNPIINNNNSTNSDSNSNSNSNSTALNSTALNSTALNSSTTSTPDSSPRTTEEKTIQPPPSRRSSMPTKTNPDKKSFHRTISTPVEVNDHVAQSHSHRDLFENDINCGNPKMQPFEIEIENPVNSSNPNSNSNKRSHHRSRASQFSVYNNIIQKADSQSDEYKPKNPIRAVLYKVSERSERALRKTSILAMYLAKWLQPTIQYSTNPLNSFGSLISSVLYYKRASLRSAQLVHQPIFEGFIFAIIIGNTVVLAMESPAAMTDPDTKFTLGLLNQIFTSIFATEMIFKWVGMGLPRYFAENWNR